MKESEYKELLEKLSMQYSQKIISVEEYRLKRKSILDEIDRELNNIVIIDMHTPSDTGSILSKAMAFFKQETHKN